MKLLLSIVKNSCAAYISVEPMIYIFYWF